MINVLFLCVLPFKGFYINICVFVLKSQLSGFCLGFLGCFLFSSDLSLGYIVLVAGSFYCWIMFYCVDLLYFLRYFTCWYNVLGWYQIILFSKVITLPEFDHLKHCHVSCMAHMHNPSTGEMSHTPVRDYTRVVLWLLHHMYLDLYMCTQTHGTVCLTF